MSYIPSPDYERFPHLRPRWYSNLAAYAAASLVFVGFYGVVIYSLLFDPQILLNFIVYPICILSGLGIVGALLTLIKALLNRL